MSPESEERWKRMERKMEFILEMQAQSEVRHAKLQEQMAIHQERMAQNEERLSKSEEQQAKLDARFERHVAGMRRLTVLGMRMLRKQNERILDVEKMTAQMTASQEELRASLKAFLDSMKKGTNGHN